MEETQHWFAMARNLKNNGITYQPQLVFRAGFLAAINSREFWIGGIELPFSAGNLQGNLVASWGLLDPR